MVRKRRKSILDSTTVPEDSCIFFILDEDPIQAARCLPLSKLALHARVIAESLAFQYLTYNAIVSERTIKSYYRFKPKSFIFQTAYDITFFSIMYEEICRIYKACFKQELVRPRRFDPKCMLYCTNMAVEYANKKAKLTFPDYIGLIKRFKAYSQYNIEGIVKHGKNDIALHRLMFMVDGYSLEDFPYGAPSWYSPMRREVYRKYDRLSKKTFIIVTDSESKYRYYYQLYSGTLIEITDINNIKELIDSFLYQG